MLSAHCLKELSDYSPTIDEKLMQIFDNEISYHLSSIDIRT